MQIKDLQARQGSVGLVAEVIEVSEPRQFSKDGKDGKVANAILQDETGKVKLSLWNEQIDQVKVGKKVEVKNGWVGEWQGELQLSTGKFGTLSIIEGSSAPVTPVAEPANAPIQPAIHEQGGPVPLADPFAKKEEPTEPYMDDSNGAPADVEEERID